MKSINKRLLLLFLAGFPVVFLSMQAVKSWTVEVNAPSNVIVTKEQYALADALAEEVTDNLTGDLYTDIDMLIETVSSHVEIQFPGSTNPYRAIESGMGSLYGVAAVYRMMLDEAGYEAVIVPVYYGFYPRATYPAVIVQGESEIRIIFIVNKSVSNMSFEEFDALTKSFRWSSPINYPPEAFLYH